MESQKKVFLEGEGDQWFSRNQNAYAEESDQVVQLLIDTCITPGRVLEIGCSKGHRLNLLHSRFSSDCYGIDPSSKAIETGRETFPKLQLQTGTADTLAFPDGFFNTIIFGFCLYLCDRKDLFKIAYEADRCLADEGHIVILDFYPPVPFKNSYSHVPGLFSYKMDYSRLFSWNPSYNPIHLTVTSHAGFARRNDPNEKLGISILNKDTKNAYPPAIYER